MEFKKNRPDLISFIFIYCCNKSTIIDKVVGHHDDKIKLYVCPYCLKSIYSNAKIEANSHFEAKQKWKEFRKTLILTPEDGAKINIFDLLE